MSHLPVNSSNAGIPPPGHQAMASERAQHVDTKLLRAGLEEVNVALDRWLRDYKEFRTFVDGSQKKARRIFQNRPVPPVLKLPKLQESYHKQFLTIQKEVMNIEHELSELGSNGSSLYQLFDR